MKKILILVLMLLLVGCSNSVDISYENGSTIDISWYDGTATNVTDEVIVKSVYDLVNGNKLEKLVAEDTTGYVYFIQFDSQTSIRLTDKLILGISGEDFTFKTSIKNELEALLSDYLPKDGTVVVELEPENTDVVDSEIVEDIDLTDYTEVGKLSDGSLIYYLSGGTYYKLELASKIIKIKDGKSIVLDEGDLSVPSISPSGDDVAYVNGVGFEKQGIVKLYRNDALTDMASSELKEKENDNRTVKFIDWYSDTQLICILGYNSGRSSQGGDVYLVHIETGQMKMLVDSKEGKEIASVSFDEPVMTYDVVTWLDDSYQYYTYESKDLDLTSLTSGLPVKEEWQPNHLELNRVSAEEILSLDLFDETLVKGDMTHLTLDDGGYLDGAIEYIFSSDTDTIWKIAINGETSNKLPRNIAVGQTLEEVLFKLPHEKNYIKEEGLIYGEKSIDNESKTKTAEITRIGNEHELIIRTGENLSTIKVLFESGIVNKIEIYFYESN